MICSLCKGNIEETSTTYMTSFNGCYIIIKNVPCKKCTQAELEYLNKIGQEISQMKEGSIALINQITTVSKIRIFDPRNLKGVLSGISLSEESMIKINNKLKELYVFN